MSAEPAYTIEASDHPLDDDADGRPLTDEELRQIAVGRAWFADTQPYNDLSVELPEPPNSIIAPQITPSEFTEFAFRMPTQLGWENFSFEGRRHLYQPYDTPAKRILLFCGRQVEKSTMLGNKALSLACLIPSYKILYVSPSATQTKTFSNDRIKDPIETSPILRTFTSHMLSQNIFEKQFANRSKITLRYAFLNADRTRGVPAHSLLIDEIQDILSENIPVIEQCTSHSPEELKRFIYAGTPKSLDSVIEDYRANRSTQGEWVVPCDCQGGEGGRYWNILGEKNIGKKGLICEHCGKPLNSMTEGAQWAWMVKYDPTHTPFESYRVPQLMVPWLDWTELLHNYEYYPRNKFYNEVLGISFDTGLRPLTQAQVRACCNKNVFMSDVGRYRGLAYGQDIFAGIDWGCHDEETRILTQEGFKYFRELTDSDKVAQWDPGTREMTFVLPKVRTVRDWNQPLLHFETRGGLDLMVTHTHRMRTTVAGRENWLTESAGETAERGGNVNFVGYVHWNGVEREEFVLPGLPVSSGYVGSEDKAFRMDDWLELLGYLITEGGLCFNGEQPSCLKMSQRETVNYDTYRKMQACLDRNNVSFSTFPNPKTGDVNWTIYGKQYWKWYAENVGTDSSSKHIPREFLSLSQRQLRILFQALVDGDGYTDPREGCTGGAFYSTSKGLCEDFQELCIKLGLRCVVRLHKPAEGNRRTRWRAMWSEGRDYYFTTPSTSVKRVLYSGKVYCCAVPSGYIVTERNGSISYQGNTGENTYTVLSLGTYVGTKFRIFFIHRFTGEDTEPERQLEQIEEICRTFNVRLIGADYGGGFYNNNRLLTKFGPERLQKYQYVARLNSKLRWEGKLLRWMVHRTEAMSAVFTAIKRGTVFEFPRWEEMKDPFAQDMLNIYSEYNERLRMIQYDCAQGRTDDTFHSILYCFLASMIIRPRPDIIAPRREDPHTGVIHSTYTGPTYQG